MEAFLAFYIKRHEMAHPHNTESPYRFVRSLSTFAPHPLPLLQKNPCDSIKKEVILLATATFVWVAGTGQESAVEAPKGGMRGIEDRGDKRVRGRGERSDESNRGCVSRSPKRSRTPLSR